MFGRLQSVSKAVDTSFTSALNASEGESLVASRNHDAALRIWTPSGSAQTAVRASRNSAAPPSKRHRDASTEAGKRTSRTR
jgi:hypothetical protein